MLPLGIGSLPHTDTASALRLINETMGQIPHWPQLPYRSPLETMVNQYAFPLINLGFVSEKEEKLFFDPSRDNWQKCVADFHKRYQKIKDGKFEDLDFFSFPEKSAQGFYDFLQMLKNGEMPNSRYVKGQITGPITLAMQIMDPNGKSAFYCSELREIIAKSLALQAYWQTKTLNQFGKHVIIFMDEPGLYGISRKSPASLNKLQITMDLDEVISSIHLAHGVAGIHVCASTDWSLILASQTDILNFDAYEYFAGLTYYPEQLKAFLERGGILAWGLIPTNAKVLELTADDLKTQYYEYVDALANKGVPKELLLQQALITPTCGVGNCSVAVAEKVYLLTAEVALAIKASSRPLFS